MEEAWLRYFVGRSQVGLLTSVLRMDISVYILSTTVTLQRFTQLM